MQTNSRFRTPTRADTHAHSFNSPYIFCLTLYLTWYYLSKYSHMHINQTKTNKQKNYFCFSSSLCSWPILFNSLPRRWLKAMAERDDMDIMALLTLFDMKMITLLVLVLLLLCEQRLKITPMILPSCSVIWGASLVVGCG